MGLPSCADVDGTQTSQLLSFINLKTSFKNQEVKLPRHRLESDPDQSQVSLSFGKDSLLSWAVCRE
ncbi:MAG TPA: hypothetical protein ENF19_02255 [Candidatus Bathyarchaeota archaeon]|nr:hypothetical protein [Candidatus Bathyarchaeota archaeon]